MCKVSVQDLSHLLPSDGISQGYGCKKTACDKNISLLVCFGAPALCPAWSPLLLAGHRQ